MSTENQNKPIRYVVTGLPRSATKYISVVLQKLGLNCTHEKSFNCYNHKESATKEGIWGDASWAAAPFICNLPPNTIVFHQVRDPLKVLNSNLPPGGDSFFRTWDVDAGLASDSQYKKPLPWKRFIWDHTCNWEWPNEVAEGPESLPEIERIFYWWMRWNAWIEQATSARADLTYFRYKVEDLANGKLLKIVKTIDPESLITEEHCNNVIKEVSTTTNRHRVPNTKITVDTLPEELLVQAQRYGYYLPG